MAENSRADHGEISPAVRGTAEKSHRQGGAVSIQEYLSTGKSQIVKEELFSNQSLTGTPKNSNDTCA